MWVKDAVVEVSGWKDVTLLNPLEKKGYCNVQCSSVLGRENIL